MTNKVLVDAEALSALLKACIGPGHLIRELQHTRSLDDARVLLPNLGKRNPINQLLDEYNEAARCQFEPQITWPEAKRVERSDDMSPHGDGVLQVMLDSDHDVVVSIRELHQTSSVEFCTGPGGGHSPKTREALIALMVAIEQDNKARPDRSWPPTQ